MSEITRQEILIKEYEEGGRACRNNDTLTRTGLSIYSATQAAIIGFLATRMKIEEIYFSVLAIIGILLSCVVFCTTRRLHMRNKNYMERMRDIEYELGMNLYEYSYRSFKRRNISEITGNKLLWSSVPLVISFLYFLLIFFEYPEILYTAISLLSSLCPKLCPQHVIFSFSW
jgi:hypothetical protein